MPAGALQQSDQFGMRAAVDHVRPQRLQPQARRGEMRDRAIELFQRVAQRSGDAGVLQGGIDEADVDLQGIGVARRAAEQRGQCSMFLRGELADAKAFDRGVERRAFETLAQALAQRGEAGRRRAGVAAVRRPRNSCRRKPAVGVGCRASWRGRPRSSARRTPRRCLRAAATGRWRRRAVRHSRPIRARW